MAAAAALTALTAMPMDDEIDVRPTRLDVGLPSAALFDIVAASSMFDASIVNMNPPDLLAGWTWLSSSSPSFLSSSSKPREDAISPPSQPSMSPLSTDAYPEHGTRGFPVQTVFPVASQPMPEDVSPSAVDALFFMPSRSPAVLMTQGSPQEQVFYSSTASFNAEDYDSSFLFEESGVSASGNEYHHVLTGAANVGHLLHVQAGSNDNSHFQTYSNGHSTLASFSTVAHSEGLAVFTNETISTTLDDDTQHSHTFQTYVPMAQQPIPSNTTTHNELIVLPKAPGAKNSLSLQSSDDLCLQQTRSTSLDHHASDCYQYPSPVIGGANPSSCPQSSLSFSFDNDIKANPKPKSSKSSSFSSQSGHSSRFAIIKAEPTSRKRSRTSLEERESVETVYKDDNGNVVGTYHVSGSRRRPRLPYSSGDRERIHLTRRIGACSRCKRLKIRCQRESPYKQCIGCSSSNSSRRLIFTCMPLSLDKPEVAELFRKGPSRKHPHYIYISRSDLYCLPDSTNSSNPNCVTLRLTQDFGEELTVSVAKYEPQPGENTGHAWKDDQGRPRKLDMPPYRIANLEEARKNIAGYIERFKSAFYRQISSHSNEVISEIVESARRFSQFSSDTTVSKALDLFAINRIIERVWRICGDETLGMSVVLEDGSPWFNTIPITPIMDTQLDQIVIKLFLEPLRAQVLNELQEKIYQNRRETWFETFLTTSILLINAEWLLRHSRSRAIQYGATDRYISLERAASYFHACTIFITHFHYICNGTAPLLLDWSSADGSLMANLDPEQLGFMQRIQRKMKSNESQILNLRKKHKYEAELYWCHQLFFPDWTPDTGGIKEDIPDDDHDMN